METTETPKPKSESKSQSKSQSKIHLAAFITRLQTRHILIMGLSRTGSACARFCSTHKIPYSISDSHRGDTQRRHAEALTQPSGFPPQSISWGDNEIRERLLYQPPQPDTPNTPISRLAVSPTTDHTVDPSTPFATMHITDPAGIAILDPITDIILSPGIPRRHPLIVLAESKNIRVWSDIDFFYPAYQHKTIIAITGTDGKTTTAKLTQAFVSTTKTSTCAGNIGTPIADLLLSPNFAAIEVIILELSSYMLEVVTQFRAELALILNIHPDHMDRYASFTDYAQAKLNIIKHSQAGDIFLTPAEKPTILAQIASMRQSKTLPVAFSDIQRLAFSVKANPMPNQTPATDLPSIEIPSTDTPPMPNPAALSTKTEFSQPAAKAKGTNFSKASTDPRQQEIIITLHPIGENSTPPITKSSTKNLTQTQKNEPISVSLESEQVRLPQAFINHENIAAAWSIARLLGVPKSKLHKTLQTFTPPPHRMEIVQRVSLDKQGGELTLPLAINDSKATTIDAVRNALSFFDTPQKSKLILIMGGQDKRLSFAPLWESLKSIKALYLYGEASETIKKQLLESARATSQPVKEAGEKHITRKIHVHKRFDDVVTQAWVASRHVSRGCILLFSPGCASFDQFKSYEERGDAFRQLIADLQARETKKERT